MPTEQSVERSTTTNTYQEVLNSIRNKDYRRAFAADVGTGLAFQIRALRESRGWTQQELARRMDKRQETISQWENPDYGRYTLNTLIGLADAFDVALIAKFGPFSELIDWIVNLTPSRLAPPSFDQETAPTSLSSADVAITSTVAEEFNPFNVASEPLVSGRTWKRTEPRGIFVTDANPMYIGDETRHPYSDIPTGSKLAAGERNFALTALEDH